MQALERALIYQKAKSDIIFFAEYFLHHLLKCQTPEFHKEIYELLGSEKRVAIAAPRSFAKSTIVDIIYTLHILLYSTQEDILIVSNSGALALEWIRKVKLELELNEKLINIFGDQESDKWTEDHIILANGNQLRGKGRGYQIRGFRPTKVILDDLEDDEMVRSKDQRDKLREWFLGALLNTLEPRQQLIYIGTLLHPLSLLKEIIEGLDLQYSSWSKRVYKAIVRGQNMEETSIWAEKWSVEQLQQRRLEIGSQKFEAEYMNNPLADSTVVFHPDTYKYYEQIEEPIIQIITGFDLIATEREFADKAYVAFVTLAKGKSGRIYCIDSRRGRWTQDEIVDQFIQIYDTHKPLAFVGEEVAFQQIVHDYLIKTAREKYKKYLPISPIKLGSYTDSDPLRKAKDKVSRALTVQHIFTQGLFHLKRIQRDLYEELSTFPASDYSDQVDAMVHSLHVLTDRVKIETLGHQEEQIAETPFTNIPSAVRFKKLGHVLDNTGGAF